MKRQFAKSLRFKIILATAVFALGFSAVMGAVIYRNYQSLLRKNLVDITAANLRLVTDKLDEDFGQIRSLLEWATINSQLSDLLIADSINAKNGPVLLDFLKRFSDMSNGAGISGLLAKVVIGGETDMSLQLGTMYGNPADVALCKQSDWFAPLYEKSSLVWPGIVKNPFTYANDSYLIPVVRPVYSYLRHKNVGFIMVGVRGDLPLSYLQNYTLWKDSQVMICNSAGQIIAHNNVARIGSVAPEYEPLSTMMAGRSAGSTTWKMHGTDITAVFQQSTTTGWYVVQTLSTSELNEQSRVMIRILLLTALGIAVMTVFVFFALHYFINKPVQRILQQLDRVAEGDFSPCKSIETEDELGTIGKGINTMSASIHALIVQSVLDEKNKKELELSVLQTQVNPHFLYNTLNSIKWMATIQKASGIGEMATALSHLLKNMAKGISSEIPLKEEISLVQDYITIQRFRYGESFRTQFSIAPELEACKIVKFTLQPLIENAIFHGLEPKAGVGEITISAVRKGETLVLCVQDNGVGMEQTQIEAVFSAQAPQSKDSLSGLGMRNVADRIRLRYGADYGMHIQSEPGVYTAVSIVVPYLL